MTQHYSDVTTGWSLDCQTDKNGSRPPPGGLWIEEVQHNHHNFARNIRTIGLRLNTEEISATGAILSTKSIFLPLSDPPFTVSPISVLTPLAPVSPAGSPSIFKWLRESDEALWFSTYFKDGANYAVFGLRADYSLPAAWFTANLPNCEVHGLEISQRLLFSRYSKVPPHEPSGNLTAARCHPLIKFEFKGNSGVDRTKKWIRISSLRFDYRLHLFLDRHHSSPTALPQLGNNAGVFRDKETLDVAGAATSVKVAKAVFHSVEKPLVFEITAPGLAEGLSRLGPRTTSLPNTGFCWDNVHWWGTRGGPGSSVISAPGAPHAAHIHWRWGAAGAWIRATIPEIDTSGVPAQAQSNLWAGGRGALVDYDCWIQTIKTAVVKNDSTLDPATGQSLESLCREDWATLFTAHRTVPADISAGADIVFWYSTEVHRQTFLPAEFSYAIFPQIKTPARALTLNFPMRGTVFLHGIFFAHDAEEFSLQAGNKDPAYWPNSESSIRAKPQWFRTAG